MNYGKDHPPGHPLYNGLEDDDWMPNVGDAMLAAAAVILVTVGAIAATVVFI